MTTTIISNPDHFMRSLPEDLRQAVGEDALLELAQQAAQAVASSSDKADHDHQHRQFMLFLLAYCYAAAIYSSKEVESVSGRDPKLLARSGGSTPDWRKVWRFRNANRPWIEDCLARIFTALSANESLVVESNATPKVHLSAQVTPASMELARRKVRRAVWMDSALYQPSAGAE